MSAEPLMMKIFGDHGVFNLTFWRPSPHAMPVRMRGIYARANA